MDMELDLGSFLGGSSSSSRSSQNKYATYKKYEDDERDSSYSKYDEDEAKSVVSSLFADVFGSSRRSSRTERYPSRAEPTQSKEISNLHSLLSNEADDDLESIMARLSSKSGIEQHLKEKEEAAEKAAKEEEDRIKKEALEKIQAA